ncbi:tetratricopeptide repeat protein [Phaeovulum sp.]|uniref:tetratricopeptide repeat protein n=1 Tax=Phaeovulum sp. TaxID=2934796 RepID=UPI0039E4FA98
MSETDSFIDEVTEEVRRDRLFALMRRYGWIGILLVVLIVGGAAYKEWKYLRDTAQAQAFGDKVLAAMEAEDRGAALAAIDTDKGRAGVLGLLRAAEAVERGQPEAARTALEALANDTALPASLRALAQLKAVMVAGTTMEPAARDAALASLAAPGAPFRALAMEQQATIEIEAGRTDEAVALLRQILAEAGLTAGLRQRATEVMVTLGVDPAAE